MGISTGDGTDVTGINLGEGTGFDLPSVEVETEGLTVEVDNWYASITDNTGHPFTAGYELNNPLPITQGTYVEFIFSAGPSPPCAPPGTFLITIDGQSESILVEDPNQETIIRGHLFSNPGSYTVNLLVTDSKPEARSDTLHIIVRQTTTSREFDAEITNPSNNDTVGLIVGFTALASYGEVPYNFTWDFGDGSAKLSSSDATVTHQYADSGVYGVTMTATDLIGNSATDTVEITVGGEGSESPHDYTDYWVEQVEPITDLMAHLELPGPEGEVLQWLTRRRALKNIPFQYLVPTEDALPPETIRFFHIDRNWIDALIDGCLSVALTTSREREWLLEEIEDPIWAAIEDLKMWDPMPVPDDVQGFYFEHFDINSDGLLDKSDYIEWQKIRLKGEEAGSYLVDGEGQSGFRLIIDTGTKPIISGQTLTIDGNHSQTYTVEKIEHADGGFTSSYGTTVTEIILTTALTQVPADDAVITLEGDSIPDGVVGNILSKLQKIIDGETSVDHRPCNEMITNYENIMRNLNSMELWYRGMYYNTLYRTHTGGNPGGFKEGDRLTGMLFRSTIVRDFPGMEISAYKGTNWGPGNLVQIIRMERLSESIMLCIFNGVPTRLRIQEPSEGIRMGVDVKDPGTYDLAGAIITPYTYKLKLKDGDATLLEEPPQQGVPTQGISIPVQTRSNSPHNDILDIKDMYDNLLASDAAPAGAPPPASTPQIQNVGFPLDSVSAFMAAQVLQFPYQQDFVRLADIAIDHPEINFDEGSI